MSELLGNNINSNLTPEEIQAAIRMLLSEEQVGSEDRRARWESLIILLVLGLCISLFLLWIIAGFGWCLRELDIPRHFYGFGSYLFYI